MKYTHSLQKIGLSEEESIIYEGLLSSGQTSLINISRVTGIHRPGVYKILPRLIRKNLVIEVKVGKRIEYVAASPQKLEPILQQSKNVLDTIVQNITDTYSKNMTTPSIEMYYGESGINSVFEDIVYTLKKGDTYYKYSIRKDIVREFLSPVYKDLVAKKQIERLVITQDAGKKRKSPLLERSVRVLTGDYDIFNVVKIVYADKVVYIDYDHMSAFTIQNQRIASMEKELFLTLYKSLPRG
jgi:sugar-specific transcriptional regulator TrmB